VVISSAVSSAPAAGNRSSGWADPFMKLLSQPLFGKRIHRQQNTAEDFSEGAKPSLALETLAVKGVRENLCVRTHVRITRWNDRGPRTISRTVDNLVLTATFRPCAATIR